MRGRECREVARTARCGGEGEEGAVEAADAVHVERVAVGPFGDDELVRADARGREARREARRDRKNCRSQSGQNHPSYISRDVDRVSRVVHILLSEL